jgi:hypothetical protein
VLRVRLEREASNYFFDNGDLTLDLRIAVEELIFTNGIPTQGSHDESLDGTHIWGILDHIVVYKIERNWLNVEVVMPVI